MTRAWRQLLCLTAFLLAPLSWAEGPGSGLEEQQRLNREIVEQNDFNTTRGLAEYGRDLGPEFRARVSSLRAGDVWVDLGAGDSEALIEYLTKDKVAGFDLPPLDQRAKVVALAYVAPKPSRRNRLALEKLVRQRGAGVYRELIGDFREIPLSRFSGASVMTSNMGVLSYVEDFTYTMQKSLEAVNQDGMLFIRTDVENVKFPDETGVFATSETAERTSAKIRKNLGRFSGAQLSRDPLIYLSEYSDVPLLELSFRRTGEGVEVPSFRVESLRAGRPPDRGLVRDNVSRKEELTKLFAAEEASYRDPLPKMTAPKTSCIAGFKAALQQLFGRRVTP